MKSIFLLFLIRNSSLVNIELPADGAGVCLGFVLSCSAN